VTTIRTQVVSVNSVNYTLHQPGGTGPRAFEISTAAYDESNTRPFVTVLPFGGGGIGPTLGGGANTYNYGYDTDARIQGQIGPGPKISTLALTGAGTITKLYTARDASAGIYLYVVNDSAKLFKVKMSDLSTTYTVTFAHAASPNLTDLVVVKDGSAPGVSDRGITQPAGTYLMAFFGETAPIQYTTAVATAGVDTWAGAAATAYGGTGLAMQGFTNTETWVFKSTGASGQSSGAFSRLQYAAVTTSAATDYSDSSSSIWKPATPYQVGQFGSSITSITTAKIIGSAPLSHSNIAIRTHKSSVAIAIIIKFLDSIMTSICLTTLQDRRFTSLTATSPSPASWQTLRTL
jgi:hypothetical protein